MSLLSESRFQNEEEAYRYVESRIWPQGAICPRCGRTQRTGRLNGSSTRIGTYKCYGCRKPFTVKINTIFERSHVLMHVWLKAIYLFGSSRGAISVQDLRRILEVSPRTAAYIVSRLRRAMKADGQVRLSTPASTRENFEWSAIEMRASKLPSAARPS